LDKIQIIEKLFSFTLLYSFLLISLLAVFNKHRKSKIIITLALYGIVFFLFLFFYYDIPKEYRKAQQTVYTALEYSFFAYIFFSIINNLKTRRIIILCSIIFILFQIVYYFTSPPQKIDSIPIGIETIFILVYVFLYFNQNFKYNLSENLYEYSSFWLIVGIIIYLGFGFFFNILANNLTAEEFEKYWHYTYLTEIIKNILFALVVLGFFKEKKNQSQLIERDIPNLDMI